MLSLTLFLGLWSIIAFLGVQATPSSGLQVFEHLRGIPAGWIQGNAPRASTLIRLRLAVRQEQKATLLEQRVIELSTPDHPSYGQHMTRSALKVFLKPSSEVAEAIISWLKAESISDDSIEDDGDWINFSAAVARMERTLNAHFY
jgi:tripeptidyl-peptidase I